MTKTLEPFSYYTYDSTLFEEQPTFDDVAKHDLSQGKIEDELSIKEEEERRETFKF